MTAALLAGMASSYGGGGGSQYSSEAAINPSVNMNPNNSAPFVLDFSGSSNDALLQTSLANPFSNVQTSSNNTMLTYLAIAAAVVAIFYFAVRK